MKAFFKPIGNNNGIALVTVILVLIVVSVTSVALIGAVHSDVAMTQADREVSEGYYIARSAVEVFEGSLKDEINELESAYDEIRNVLGHSYPSEAEAVEKINLAVGEYNRIYKRINDIYIPNDSEHHVEFTTDDGDSFNATIDVKTESVRDNTNNKDIHNIVLSASVNRDISHTSTSKTLVFSASPINSAELISELKPPSPSGGGTAPFDNIFTADEPNVNNLDNKNQLNGSFSFNEISNINNNDLKNYMLEENKPGDLDVELGDDKPELYYNHFWDYAKKYSDENPYYNWGDLNDPVLPSTIENSYGGYPSLKSTYFIYNGNDFNQTQFLQDRINEDRNFFIITQTNVSINLNNSINMKDNSALYFYIPKTRPCANGGTVDNKNVSFKITANDNWFDGNGGGRAIYIIDESDDSQPVNVTITGLKDDTMKNCPLYVYTSKSGRTDSNINIGGSDFYGSIYIPGNPSFTFNGTTLNHVDPPHQTDLENYFGFNGGSSGGGSSDWTFDINFDDLPALETNNKSYWIKNK